MNGTEFFAALDRLSSGERAVLRRSSGKLLQDADARAMAAFYRCHPGISEDRWFAAACFHCLWDAGVGSKQPLEEIIRELKKKSDSMEHRLASLIDTAWDSDGYLLTKLSRIIKMARQQGYCVDCCALLNDLLYWNSDSQFVQRRWARTMCYENEMRDEPVV